MFAVHDYNWDARIDRNQNNPYKKVSPETGGCQLGGACRACDHIISKPKGAVISTVATRAATIKAE